MVQHDLSNCSWQAGALQPVAMEVVNRDPAGMGLKAMYNLCRKCPIHVGGRWKKKDSGAMMRGEMPGVQRTRLKSIFQPRRQGEMERKRECFIGSELRLITRRLELDRSHVTGLAGQQLDGQ